MSDTLVDLCVEITLIMAYFGVLLQITEKRARWWPCAWTSRHKRYCHTPGFWRCRRFAFVIAIIENLFI